MGRLTKTEEQIMQIIWELGPCLVRDVREKMGDPKPPHSTISSVFRILESKGFLTHKAYGRTYEYTPTISKEDYSNQKLNSVVKDYFQGSFKQLVSFFVKENDLNPDEIADMVKLLDNHKNKEGGKDA